MLQEDSTELHEPTPAVCFIASSSRSLNATDSSWPRLAASLRRAGWDVHVLYCGEAIGSAARQCREAGLVFSTLDSWNIPSSFAAPNRFGRTQADQSDRARLALEQLARKHPLRVAVFEVRGGLGFRSIQAKAAGVGLATVSLAVQLDSCSPWVREREHRWPRDLEDLAIDYAERVSFEQADLQIALCPRLVEYVRRMGWTVQATAVLPSSGGEEAVPVRLRDVSGQLPRLDAEPGSRCPKVTVAAPYYNGGLYLEEALQSLAAQTYPNLEVLVINDGTTDPHSLAVFERMQTLYPDFRYLHQVNQGIGAARNRGLREACGEYFIPMDADNIAMPEMVERFVTAIERSPDLAAMSCYFLAFTRGDPRRDRKHPYAYRPLGGPHTLASMRNVYGDANAIFRTSVFRSVGGFEEDRDCSFEDWEAFVKLVSAGKRVGVVPEHLFYYRHLAEGFSRRTDSFRNHQRVLRQYMRQDRLPPAECAVLWMALHGFQRQYDDLMARHRRFPHRVADGICNLGSGFRDFLHRSLRGLARSARRLCQGNTADS